MSLYVSKSFSSNMEKITSENVDSIYEILNKELNLLGLNEDLKVHGGVVMCDLGARESTYDIDAYYKHIEIIDSITERTFGFDKINNDVEAYLSPNGEYRLYKEFSNLKVYYATDEYLLALKCRSCRTEGNDIKDLKYLLDKLNISSIQEVDKIILKFFNSDQVGVLYRDLIDDYLSGTLDYYFI